jgi:hypothetical protein
MSTTPQAPPEITYTSPATLVPSAARDFAVNMLFASSVILMLCGLAAGGMGLMLMSFPDGGGFGLAMAAAGVCLFAAGATDFVGGRQVRRGNHQWAVALLLLNLSLAVAFAATIALMGFDPCSIPILCIPLSVTSVSSVALIRICRKETRY